MSRNHIGFALFTPLLLIAPKIPLNIPGGAAESSASLGLAGLVFWYLAYPEKLFSFPRISVSHPLFWIMTFAMYSFVVSLLSGSIVSIVYAVQFLAYSVLGTVLARRYAKNYASDTRYDVDSILLGIAVVYSVGMLVSVFTGPIYPHQTMVTLRGNMRQGVGFSESQNVAGIVVVFLTTACIHMYQGKSWKKWILVCLLLLALLSTLSRSAIISFLLALILVFCFDTFPSILQRACIKVSVLKNAGLVMSTLGFLVIFAILGIYLVDKSLLSTILPFFDVTGKMAFHMTDRFNLWRWGLDNWSSGSITKMIFGGGFRSSMTVLHDRGTWRDAHNVYITILGDFGVVGLMLFLAALFSAFLRYTHLFVIERAGRAERFGLTAVLALSIHSMTGPYFYSPVCLSLLIFTLAVTLCPFDQRHQLSRR